MDKRIVFVLYQSCGNMGSVGCVFVLLWCSWECLWGLDQDLNRDYLCRWQVSVPVFCVRLMHAHPRCTQCLILLHHIDICFLRCICLWQISKKIKTCLLTAPPLLCCVVWSQGVNNIIWYKFTFICLRVI